MDDAHPDWEQFCNFDACEPAGTAAVDSEDRFGFERTIRYQTSSERGANLEPWQPVAGPSSTATGYVALTDVAPVAPAIQGLPYVDCDPTVTDQKLSAIDTEPELAATWNVETSPVQATLSDLGAQVDEVHSSVSDNLEECTCLACVQERHPVFILKPRYSNYHARCRISPCTILIYISFHHHKTRFSVTLPQDDRHHSLDYLCYHERTHFEYQGKYKCAEKDCGHLTKEFRDLKRHHRAKHCTKTPEFPCDAPGCKFGGENGFHRRDKLESHYKNIHQGQAASIARPRNILPAPASGRLSGPGTGSSSK